MPTPCSSSRGMMRLPPSSFAGLTRSQVYLCVGKDVLALELSFDPARRQWQLLGEEATAGESPWANLSPERRGVGSERHEGSRPRPGYREGSLRGEWILRRKPMGRREGLAVCFPPPRRTSGGRSCKRPEAAGQRSKGISSRGPPCAHGTNTARGRKVPEP